MQIVNAAVWLSLVITIVCEEWRFRETECPHKVDRRIFDPSFQIASETPYRAFLTVPQGFSVRPSIIPGAGLGVFTDIFLRKHTWLGDYQGEQIYRKQLIPTDPRTQCAMSNPYLWVLYYNGRNIVNVDAAKVSTSNWIRWINCARNVVELNVSTHQCYGKMLYKTSKNLVPGTELFTYYGDGYAASLGINVFKFSNKTYGRHLPVNKGLWYSNRLKGV